MKYSMPMNSLPKSPAIAYSHDVSGICVAWARMAATFASQKSVPSMRAAISESGVPNGKSSMLSTPSNGLPVDSPNAANPASSTLRGIAVQ
jgi:hypothetical protein